MFRQVVLLTNPEGLHLRVCSAIVDKVERFQAKVTIQKDQDVRDGTSVLSLMTLAAPQGTELLVSADGPESEEAVRALVQLLQDCDEQLPHA